MNLLRRTWWLAWLGILGFLIMIAWQAYSISLLEGELDKANVSVLRGKGLVREAARQVDACKITLQSCSDTLDRVMYMRRWARPSTPIKQIHAEAH
jgi:hypothetical protein